MKLTWAEEKDIWRTAYAVAFAHDFCETADEFGVDDAADGNNQVQAERAITVANCATKRLREWLEIEDS